LQSSQPVPFDHDIGETTPDGTFVAGMAITVVPAAGTTPADAFAVVPEAGTTPAVAPGVESVGAVVGIG
jgi:hypothetical protein